MTPVIPALGQKKSTKKSPQKIVKKEKDIPSKV